jgi:hypothetical protein
MLTLWKPQSPTWIKKVNTKNNLKEEKERQCLLIKLLFINRKWRRSRSLCMRLKANFEHGWLPCSVSWACSGCDVMERSLTELIEWERGDLSVLGRPSTLNELGPWLWLTVIFINTDEFITTETGTKNSLGLAESEEGNILRKLTWNEYEMRKSHSPELQGCYLLGCQAAQLTFLHL